MGRATCLLVVLRGAAKLLRASAALSSVFDRLIGGVSTDIDADDAEEEDPRRGRLSSVAFRFWSPLTAEVLLAILETSFPSLVIIRLRVEFQRFLMELSVRPGSRLAISAQRLPSAMCAFTSI